MKRKLYQVDVTYVDKHGHLVLAVVYYDVSTSKRQARLNALVNMGRYVKSWSGYDAQVRNDDVFIVNEIKAHEGGFTWVHPAVPFFLREMSNNK